MKPLYFLLALCFFFAGCGTTPPTGLVGQLNPQCNVAVYDMEGNIDEAQWANYACEGAAKIDAFLREHAQLPFLPAVDNVHVFVELYKGEGLAGEYEGYNTYPPKIQLWIDSVDPRNSAMMHEFMHAYDHRVLETELYEWVEHEKETGYHFMMEELALEAIKVGKR